MRDLTGQTIGQYQIVELIHRGENTVYKAFQASMNRYVAVKVLNPALAANPAFARQFQQELERLAALQHPNILPVYDFGQQDEMFYIVSRYVETGTLKDRLPPAFSPQQAQAMLNPIAEALDLAYRLGVASGNLKPSNVLIDAQGRPLVTDLGYVQGLDAGGTEKVYLSPEETQGAVPDPRSDVYALGVLLYHMLAGELPLPGTAFNVRTRRPELPIEIEKVIFKATAQLPEHRFQSPGRLAEAFNQALMPQAVPQPPPSAPQPAPPAPAAEPTKRSGPSWLVLLLVGGLVALCCLTGGLGLFFAGGEREVAPPTAPPPDSGQPAPEPTPPRDGSLLQGFFDLIGNIFEGLVGIIDRILGGGAPPPEPSPEPPGEQPPPEQQPPPEEPPPAEQLPEEPAEQPAEESGDTPVE
jgi:serine/threonine protein kinase